MEEVQSVPGIDKRLSGKAVSMGVFGTCAFATRGIAMQLLASKAHTAETTSRLGAARRKARFTVSLPNICGVPLS
jgi:ABC-type sulfate transport system permease subunit